MNTIHEQRNGDINDIKAVDANHTNNNNNNNVNSSTFSTSSTTNTTSGTTTTTTTTSTTTNTGNNNNEHFNESPISQSSGNDDVITSSSDDYVNELKIIGHFKNFEKINEQRHIFLTNTISEYTTDETFETKTETGTATNGINGKVENDIVHIINEKRTQIREDNLSDLKITPPLSPKPSKGPRNSATPKTSPTSPTAPQIPTSPTSPKSALKSPPPKPPLSRTPSINTDNRNSLNLSTPKSATLPRTSAQSAIVVVESTLNSIENEAHGAEIPIIATAVKTAVLPEVVKETKMQLQTNTPVMRRTERPMSTPESPKPISVNHYERLIEELKCPGCANPMKAPVLLCRTGHSICEQCTRVLMLCPLCKEPFTDIRSRTVEALCSKAHFRCANAPGGCTVRLHIDLLNWHEKQCIYKPMKCFMGRVWGDCHWSGREAFWKDHLESDHSNKVFQNNTTDLMWNMGVKQKPLTGYYVFLVFGEMFNFYEIYDKERVLFTMTCTSTIKEKKHSYAFEVTLIHRENEALAITQKFPVHSEYDNDILAEGTCVSILLTDLAKFIDDEKLLHYRVSVLEIKSPRKSKPPRFTTPKHYIHPIDFQQTQIEGVNLKNVPSDVIVTRKMDDIPYADNATTPTGALVAGSSPVPSSEDEIERIRRLYNSKHENKDHSDSETDPELEAFIAKRWGTPQLHFNRKYLKTNSSESSSNSSKNRYQQKHDVINSAEERMSICSTNTNMSYKQKVTNKLRKSFRNLKTPIIELKPFGKKTVEKTASN